MVKARPALLSVDSDDSDSLPKFCHQHSKELMSPSGYYSRKNGEWVKFEGDPLLHCLKMIFTLLRLDPLVSAP